MPEDVTPADPSAAVAPEVSSEAGSAPGDVAPVSSGDDRPVQNVVAEFNRKMSKLQSQYDTLMQYVVTQTQSGGQTQSAPKDDPTDDELWSLAQQGDRQATNAYMQRIAARSQQVQLRQFKNQRLVENQLSILAQRYPVLNDASHPLTQQVNATYQALVTRGYATGPATTLEAVKTAIADRPDLVAELYTPTQPVRRERVQAGITGATVREGSSPSPTKPISEAEAALAKRMGVRDPAKAKLRFQQRQDSGQSSVADTLHPFIREE